MFNGAKCSPDAFDDFGFEYGVETFNSEEII